MSKKLNPADFGKSFDKTCDRCFLKITMRKPVNSDKNWLPCKFHTYEFHACSSMKKARADDNPPVNGPLKRARDRRELLPPESFPEENPGEKQPVEVELSVKGKKVMCPVNRGMPCKADCAWFCNGVCAVRMIALTLPGAGRGY